MRKWWHHSRSVALIWAFSFSILFLLLRLMMDTQNYSSLVANSPEKLWNKYFPRTLTKNSSLYHFSMFQAPHRISPVPATYSEIDAEADDVKAITQDICPLRIVLDRVVLTLTGVLLGCWQVVSGTDPVSIRVKLKKSPPHAPEKQLDEFEASQRLPFFNELVARLNNRISGSQATVSELWYVEEYDVLALALNGRMRARRYELRCSGQEHEYILINSVS